MIDTGMAALPAAENAAGKRVLFVASTGGHLAQLNRMAVRMDAAPDSVWLTFDNEQSRSLLAGREKLLVPYVAPRDLPGVARTFRVVLDLLGREHFDQVISTGAAVAFGAFAAARLRGVPTTYIESVSRIAGPSLTGRLLAGTRLATRLRTQHSGWATRRWVLHPSVLADFAPVPRSEVPPAERPLKIFVTLGTIKPYRFDALIDALLATGEMSGDTVWQLGETTRDDLPGTVFTQTTAAEFARYSTEADVVVTHAGVGTILELLEKGIHPVVVARERVRDEHVDDHQRQIADLVDLLGVATVAGATRLSAADLRSASRWATRALGSSEVTPA